MTTKTKGYCAKEAGSKLELIEIELPPLKEDEVQVEITHCGLCRTEHSMINNEWGISTYPMVPGHEGIGYIRKVGDKVTNLVVGDCVGIGWIRDSCGQCEACSIGRENFCHSGYQGVYLGKNAGKYGKEGAEMKGCFAQHIQIANHFAFKIPTPNQNAPFTPLQLAEMSPLFCAGLTVFEPLCDYFRSGDCIGVIGLGGLGHLALKFAKAMSAEVIVFSQSESKRSKAIEFGASDYINTSDQNSFFKITSKLDLIIDTAPVNLSDQIDQFLSCLKPNGVYCKVGLPKKGEEMKISINPMVFNAYRVVGSIVCGSVNAQRMIKVAINSNVKSDVVVLPFSEVNNALDLLQANNNPLGSSRIVLEW